MQDSTKNRVLNQKHKKFCKAEFRTNYIKYWPGTIISFSGNHAQFFYKTIKNKQLDKEIFDLDFTNIGRIDLCYDRKIQQSDQTQNLDSFLNKCCTQTNSKADATKAKIVKGVFRVGKRSSPNYFRVYPKPNGKFSSGSTIIPGANGFVPHQTYCRYHENAPLSCQPNVKVSDGAFQGDGDNN